MKTKHIQFSLFLFGLGYWKDNYKAPFTGCAYNILLPFTRIQWGYLGVVESTTTNNKKLVTDEFSYIKPHEL